MSSRRTTIAVTEAVRRKIEARVASQARAPDDEGWIELTYPPGIFMRFGVLGLLVAAFFVAVPWLDSDVTSGETILFRIAAAFFLLGSLGLLNERRARVWVGPMGIDADSPWKRDVSLDWEEVDEVRWCSSGMWYRVRGTTGTVRVHSWLGAELVEEMMIRHLDEDLVREAILEGNRVAHGRARQWWREKLESVQEDVSREDVG